MTEEKNINSCLVPKRCIINKDKLKADGCTVSPCFEIYHKLIVLNIFGVEMNSCVTT